MSNLPYSILQIKLPKIGLTYAQSDFLSFLNSTETKLGGQTPISYSPNIFNFPLQEILGYVASIETMYLCQKNKETLSENQVTSGACMTFPLRISSPEFLQPAFRTEPALLYIEDNETWATNIENAPKV